METESRKIENKQESIIDLSNVEIVVQTDDVIREALSRGRYAQYTKRVVDTKKKIEQNIDSILEEVRRKLSLYIPDWRPEKVEVKFDIFERSDYRHPRKGEIEADVVRLAFEEDPMKSVVEGVVHELFHEWIEESEFFEGISDEDIKTIEELRSVTHTTALEEGLAVFISGQSLKEFYSKRGKDCENLTKESFEFFRHFIKIEDFDEAKKRFRDGYKDMGPFYVVGNEIVKKVYDMVGEEKFKKMVGEVRTNPDIFIEEYKRICSEDSKLLQISS